MGCSSGGGDVLGLDSWHWRYYQNYGLVSGLKTPVGKRFGVPGQVRVGIEHCLSHTVLYRKISPHLIGNEKFSRAKSDLKIFPRTKTYIEHHV
jgi:hypothetical protein